MKAQLFLFTAAVYDESISVKTGPCGVTERLSDDYCTENARDHAVAQRFMMHIHDQSRVHSVPVGQAPIYR